MKLMKLIGLMPARNEDWCLGLTLRAALRWCDSVVVLDHCSTDDTWDIICDVSREMPGRVRVAKDGYSSWDEMRHRQAMLSTARGYGATHIALIDADEILTSNLINLSVAGIGIAALLEKWQMLELPGYNLRGSTHAYHSNGLWGRRWFSTVFRDTPEAHWAGDEYHHRAPMGVRWRPCQTINQGAGGVMHLWGVSERRLRAKHALYKVNERLRFPHKSDREIDTKYSWATTPGLHAQDVKPWRFEPVPDSWWAGYEDLMQYLDVDREPWQVAEVARLVELHGAGRFAGLDLTI